MNFDDIKREILERSDIVEIIAESVHLKKSAKFHRIMPIPFRKDAFFHRFA